ncbi:secreted hydrolase-like protein [Cystobacter fuscus DSM 2262]|uniref:Secreted hydrolase-like protein n=1 Tax=Cystobacter fuscus (strain ATCC 25194 / DSM 2262 / NBRC 100088 / M29) TaxID=1242864 RepID=S9QIY0_CYSF2|nr:lipocalin-like domain-containing protein [Cystobacter fuscus]EPX61229.1 secreted hydrolase-like protein [Cystobacter fuscus DSM 2262]
MNTSNIQGGRFHAFERFSRSALGLAGARTEPFRVWLEDWSADSANTYNGTAGRASAKAVSDS